MSRKIFLLSFVCFLLLTLTAAAKRKYLVKLETTFGSITIELYDNTPLHRDNFLKLVKQGFYDSLLFHRCIPNFVIQAGDPDSKHAAKGAKLGDGDLKYKIPAEINDDDFHQRGALGMARDENPDKESSACQFYIVTGHKFTDDELNKAEARSGHKLSAEHREVYKTLGGTAHLDGNYTVFGIVTAGMDVVDKIGNQPRDANDRPSQDIRIIHASLTRKHKKFFLF